jgi:hypothetical protein
MISRRNIMSAPRTITLYGADYQIFDDGISFQLPMLLAAGLKTASAADIMRLRLDSLGTEEENYLWNSAFDTSDAIITDRRGFEVKISLDNPLLRNTYSRNDLNNGALALTQKQYADALGTTCVKYELFPGEGLTKKQVMNSPVWNALAREDKALLGEYFDAVQMKTGIEQNMGLHFSHEQETPSLRACSVNGRKQFSSLYCRGDLNRYGGRLIGVAPKTQPTLTLESLDQSVIDALRDGQSFDYQGNHYEIRNR